MCRGMNEASMVAEQIASRFNPTYTLLINEIPNVQKPTSVPLQLLDLSIESQEYDELSTDIITVNAGLMLKGNFYTPIETLAKVKNVNMYMNLWHTSIKNEYSRAKLYRYDVVDNILQPTPEELNLISEDGEFGVIIPVITDIISDDSVTVNEEITLQCVVKDDDNKTNDLANEISYIWDVQGNAEIIGTGRIVNLKGLSTEVVEVRCIVTDYHSNTSNMFIKQITVI